MSRHAVQSDLYHRHTYTLTQQTQAMFSLSSGKFSILDPERLQDMTPLFLSLDLSLLLRLPGYIADFTLHSVMITQFTSYPSPLGIITTATCPLRDKRKQDSYISIINTHHTHSHSVSVVAHPSRVSKLQGNSHVKVEKILQAISANQSRDSSSILYRKLEESSTQSKHPVTCIKKWTDSKIGVGERKREREMRGKGLHHRDCHSSLEG